MPFTTTTINAVVAGWGDGVHGETTAWGVAASKMSTYCEPSRIFYWQLRTSGSTFMILNIANRYSCRGRPPCLPCVSAVAWMVGIFSQRRDAALCFGGSTNIRHYCRNPTVPRQSVRAATGGTPLRDVARRFWGQNSKLTWLRLNGMC